MKRHYGIFFLLVCCVFFLSGCQSNNLSGIWYLHSSNCSDSIQGVPETLYVYESGELGLLNVVDIKDGNAYRVRRVAEYGSWNVEQGRISITGPNGSHLVAFKDMNSASYETKRESDNNGDSILYITIVLQNGDQLCYKVDDRVSSNLLVFSYDPSETEVIDNR